MPLYAGVEGGGTTFRVCVARVPAGDATHLFRSEDIVDRKTFDTLSPPEKTLSAVHDWLMERHQGPDGPFLGLGIATFGPVDLHTESKTYGFITTTPKVAWRNTDVVGRLRRGMEDVPFAFDTDVNAPALDEFDNERAERPEDGLSSCAYITVGTGIGVGLVVNSQCVHGLLHPEGGHAAVPRSGDDAPEFGRKEQVPFGGQGAECLANSEAIFRRVVASHAEIKDRRQLAELPDDDPVWDTAAYYLGALCANLVLIASPERIVISGGVMKRAILFDKVRAHCQRFLAGYISHPKIVTAKGIATYIVPSRHGDDAGIVSTLSLARRARRAAGGGEAAGGRRAGAVANWAPLAAAAVAGAAACALVMRWTQ